MSTTASQAHIETESSPMAQAATASPARRIWDVVRLHLANPFPTLVLPWAITMAIFALNMAIMLIVVKAAGGLESLEDDAFAYNGGITWIVFFMIVVAVQTMNLNFRFALGFSVTRRDFYWGSVAYFVMLSLLYGTGVTVLAGIERVTDGWGIGAAFFAPWGLGSESLLDVWAVFTLVLLLFFFIGAAVATVWVRWKANGLYTFFIAFAAVLVAAGWLVTVAGKWGAAGEYFVTHSIVEIVLWTLPVTVVCMMAGFLFLRKATPQP